MRITKRLKTISLNYRDLRTISIISRAEQLLQKYPNKEVYIFNGLKRILEKSTSINNQERRLLVNILLEELDKKLI